jgi:PhzF family phenazine biosynthesis protein
MQTIINIWTVDAFSTKTFGGNQAAVVILDDSNHSIITENTMQLIAAEMNLSETTFLTKRGHNHFHIRWFTPTVEVELCGHATLAAAHVLFQQQLIDNVNESVQFDSLSGPLIISKYSGDNSLFLNGITLDFPATFVEQVSLDDSVVQSILKSLQIDTVVSVNSMNQNYIVELDSEESVRRLTPDFTSLQQISGCRSVMVTSKASSQYVNCNVDFVSRFFGPAVGINEDPVTGSAHCLLVPYWHNKLSKKHFMAYQLSKRGGLLHLVLSDDNKRVFITGNATTVLSGKLNIAM